jgi:ribosome-associated heat shock protein Hsp15
MTGTDEEAVLEASTQRLDKWLWFARVSKSRSLAARLIEDGKVRVNRTRAVKPSQTVRVGDVLTIALRGKVQILKVLAPGQRRGPPPEARQLYEAIDPDPDLTPQPRAPSAVAKREPGAGPPRKRDRRLMERFTGQD